MTEIFICVPNIAIGLLIGRGGETKRRLEAQNQYVSVQKSSSRFLEEFPIFTFACCRVHGGHDKKLLEKKVENFFWFF
jgi:hypothetical protein